MPETTIFFDEGFYLQQKLTSLHHNSEYTSLTSIDQLRDLLGSMGYTPDLHYKNYGSVENLNASPYFNRVEYLESKLLSLLENPATAADWKGKTIADLEQVMAEAGMTPAEHYAQYGYAERRGDGTVLNPSNAFDANAYFGAKLVEMQKSYPGKYDTYTVQDVFDIFHNIGLDPVSHYMLYGANEARSSDNPLVQTVPTEQRVTEDADRGLHNTLVPDNPVPPSAGPDKAVAAPVPSPGDMGGYNPDSPLAPAEKPVPAPDPKPGPDPTPPGPDSGSDPGPTPPDPDLPPTPLPDNTPIVLTQANPVVTPITTVNADGAVTSDSKNDTVEIASQAALTAQVDGGIYRGSGKVIERDKLVISVDTEGMVDLRIFNIEEVVLGTGAQNVYVGATDISNNPMLQHVGFDHADDVLTMSQLRLNTWALKSITNAGEGQGTLRTSMGGETVMDLRDVEWHLGGKLKEIYNKPGAYGSQLLMNVEDLQHAQSIKSSGKVETNNTSKAVLNLAGELASNGSTAVLDDTHVSGFTGLDLRDATLGSGVNSFTASSEYYDLYMSTTQWAQLEAVTLTANTYKAKAFTLVQNDNAADIGARNTLALQHVLKAGALSNFTTLSLLGLSSVEGLASLDISSSPFKTLILDKATMAAMTNVDIVGGAGKILQVYCDGTQSSLGNLGKVHGFDSLALKLEDASVDQTLTLGAGSSISDIEISGYSGKKISIEDNSGVTNTLKVADMMVWNLATKGIERITGSDFSLNTTSFAAGNGLKSVSGNYVHLVGDWTPETQAAIESGMVSAKMKLHLQSINITQPFSVDMGKVYFRDTTLSLYGEQAKLATVTNVETVYVDGNNLTAEDFKGFTNSAGLAPKLNITEYYEGDEVQPVSMDMTGYKGAIWFSASGTIIGGDGENTINGSDGLQRGGASADKLKMYTYENGEGIQEGGGGADTLLLDGGIDTIPTTWKGHSMTGGEGKDTFAFVRDMTKVEMVPGVVKPDPILLATIEDFASATKPDSSGDFDLIDLTRVSYFNSFAGQGTARVYYTAADVMDASAVAQQADFSKTLIEVAKVAGAGKLAVFNYAGNAYIFGNNEHAAPDVGDFLIELAGVDASTITAADFVFKA